MKFVKKIKYISILTFSLILFSCHLDDGESLNGASTSSISSDLSKGELPQAMSGVLSSMRNGLATSIDVQSVLGREYYYFTSSDPRFEGDVVAGNLDNNTFYVTTPWGARYGAIKNINLMLQGIERTTSDFSSEEISATKGVLNTFKAYELLMLVNNQYKNGIRLDVSDPNNLGSIKGYEDAMKQISDLLVSAINDLNNGGSSFPFNLTSGYEGFDTPLSFVKFTYALSARVASYRGDYNTVLSDLSKSFMDLGGELKKGIYHTFSLSGADLPNPLFIALNQESNVRVAHSSFIDDAESGDTRISKVVKREKAREASGLVGDYDVWLYKTNTDMVPMLRNEELILLYAEANIESNPVEAIKAINTIRASAGLANYSGGQTKTELVDEILMQRRYSLFGEGHRWIDMRRFNKLADLPNDRANDKVIESIPIPATEN